MPNLSLSPSRSRGLARLLRSLMWIISAGLPWVALQGADPVNGALTRDQRDGRALAAELCALQPTAGSTNQATLERRDSNGRRTQVPLTIETRLGDGGTAEWTTRYIARAAGRADSEVLSIRQFSDRPPVYVVEGGQRPTAEMLPAGQAFVPFAGSDFWLADLGLEFFHWPEQRLLPGPRDDPPMVKGRACKVLESRNPAGAPYSRVVSWIDNEFKSLIQADAYDAAGKLLKRFSIGSVTKVSGVWHLKDMEMIDERRDTKTRLQFELKVNQ